MTYKERPIYWVDVKPVLTRHVSMEGRPSLLVTDWEWPHRLMDAKPCQRWPQPSARGLKKRSGIGEAGWPPSPDILNFPQMGLCP